MARDDDTALGTNENRRLSANRRFIWPLALGGLFVLSRFWILFGFNAAFTDVDLYFHYFTRYLQLNAEGKCFFAEMRFEYPPLMLPVLLFPGFVARLGGAVTFESYQAAFRACMFVCDALVFGSLPFIVRAALPGLIARGVWLRVMPYIFVPLFLPHLLYDRLDMVVAAPVALGFALLGARRFTPGAFLLGVAVALKLTPLILAVPLLFWRLADTREGARERNQRFVLAGLLGVLLGFLPFTLAAGAEAFQFVSYQSQRGLQIESIPASLGMLTALFGNWPAPIMEARAISLIFPGVEVFQKAYTLIGLVAGLSLLGWMYLGRARMAHERLGFGRAVQASVALLAAAICFSKVFSPQFLIWLIPLLLAVPQRRWRFGVIVALLALVLGLSTALFPYAYKDLVQLKLYAQWLLGLRNLAFVALSVCLVWFWRRTNAAMCD